MRLEPLKGKGGGKVRAAASVRPPGLRRRPSRRGGARWGGAERVARRPGADARKSCGGRETDGNQGSKAAAGTYELTLGCVRRARAFGEVGPRGGPVSWR
jgi:hypothetical protein